MVSILEQYEIDAGRSNEVNNFSDIQNQVKKLSFKQKK
jgi:hypothetical protein